ncbi:DUF5686 and carboxypeptidase regulatory-like domain-containing protein [Halosquirtibacter laminarini]|uniref:DUF5686 and carboxypeptidase regulatory-like domain-containing protein n=1 Tax=Halosquirtibacter laminarini TaxID=3374600 RepID=A0AC61NHR4_9BACT|nr:DUF5686 and carboxypeptidase regulatory-like domain-containing protein [Prolixibacteraceae bacterium]
MLLLLFMSCYSWAQSKTFKGQVVDEEGNSIPYTSIYVKNLKVGTSANLTGHFEYTLDEGTYQIVFSSLGYKTKNIDVKVPLSEPLKIVLPTQQLQIQEVKVYSNGEDPAIPIMRKAIALGTYYRRVVKSYEADVYMNGSFTIVKIPKLLSSTISVNDEKGFEEGNVYSQESMSHVKFSQPDHYEQTVKAVKMVLPKSLGVDKSIDPIEFFNSSIYDDKGDLITPFSTRAFSFYKFQYLGYFMVGDRVVNKICVTPRNKNKNCFTGEIGVFDNTWDVYSVRLENEQFWGKMKIEETYNAVEKNVFMPTQQIITLKVSTMGIKVDFDYISSVKYQNIALNEGIKQPALLQDYWAKVDAENKKVEAQKQENEKVLEAQKKLDELLLKEKLSRRDLRKIDKLSDEIEKETMIENGELPEKESLEVVSHHSMKVDSTAKKKDNSFWEVNRPIPLTEAQVVAMSKLDSLNTLQLEKNKNKEEKEKKKEEKSNAFTKALDAILYLDLYSANEGKQRLYFEGISPTVENYFNPVDGFMLWSGIGYENTTSRFSTRLRAGYGFESEKVLFDFTGQKEYAWEKRGKFSWSIGSTTTDFKKDKGMSTIVDEISSLFFKDNFRRFYGSDHVTLNNEIDIANGLQFSSSIYYENRKELTNNTNYSFFRKDENYQSNTPVNAHVTDDMLKESAASGFSVGLRYTPRQYYRMDKEDKRKEILYSHFPTFEVNYNQNFAVDFLETTSKYSHLSASITQKIDLGYGDELKYFVNGGRMWNVSHFSEFKSFYTHQSPVTIVPFDQPEGRFMVADDYALNENKWYFNAYARISKQYILLKYLPGLNNTLIKEAISVNYLKSSIYDNYVEAGYSLNGIFQVVDFGFYTAFNKGSNPQYRLKLSLKLQ